MVKAGGNPVEAKQVQRLEQSVEAGEEGIKAIDLLAQAVPLSRQKLKQAMEKGGVWLKKARGGRRRLRRAKTLLQKGDVLELHQIPRSGLESIHPSSLSQRHLPPGLGSFLRSCRSLAGTGTMPFSI